MIWKTTTTIGLKSNTLKFKIIPFRKGTTNTDITVTHELTLEHREQRFIQRNSTRANAEYTPYKYQALWL
jgi:MoxR-like ATPase